MFKNRIKFFLLFLLFTSSDPDFSSIKSPEDTILGCTVLLVVDVDELLLFKVKI